MKAAGTWQEWGVTAEAPARHAIVCYVQHSSPQLCQSCAAGLMGGTGLSTCRRMFLLHMHKQPGKPSDHEQTSVLKAHLGVLACQVERYGAQMQCERARAWLQGC